MAKNNSINLAETCNNIEFEVNNKYLATVKEVTHIVDFDEWSLKPKPENYWLINFFIHDISSSCVYRIDYSPNIFSKHYVFKSLVKKILKSDSDNWYSLKNKTVSITVKKRYILNKSKSTWSKDSRIVNMSLVENKNLESLS